jgi:WD40 repeat protein
VAWSECGQTLAFSTHSSQIHVVDDMRCLDGKSDQMVSRIIVQDTFPLRSLIFTGKNNILIAAGYDGTIFSVDASTKTQINKTYRKLKPWKDSLSRNGADGIISCLQISNVGAAGSHVSASGSQGTFLIMNI